MENAALSDKGIHRDNQILHALQPLGMLQITYGHYNSIINATNIQKINFFVYERHLIHVCVSVCSHVSLQDWAIFRISPCQHNYAWHAQ